ncbi:unnamed protein product [Cylicocyclus nassatus]|uniref:Peptidase C1A papain C-terminal domain-containing protein n=1 Tax=Cylicocyclus nassatus TaxID=53992 RepID=A0AA36GMF8_CYLNA|nr:unnamed protein product [Cylicocyclus nassatus]
MLRIACIAKMIIHLAMLASLTAIADGEVEHLTGQALVDFVNKHQDFFHARYWPGAEEFVASRTMNVKYLKDPRDKLRKRVRIDSNDPIPEKFDARENWPGCSSIIGRIRDQSKCKSGWAVATAGVISDRLCIESQARRTVHISDTDLLACCGSCGNGCDGGYVAKAWNYFKESGLVTGGSYRERNCCKPYALYPCGRHANQTYYGYCTKHETPVCRKTCQLTYEKEYEEDKFYGSTWYSVVANENDIQREIMTNGPVVASMNVWSDFSSYWRGIYKHTWGTEDEKGHVVKIIGWGEERGGKKYWLAINSWNTDWGENGSFRIVRGTNECEIEANIIGGHIDLERIKSHKIYR